MDCTAARGALWPAPHASSEQPLTSTPTLVKICGLSTPESVETAIAAGADLIGLVFFAKSPRCVTLVQARDLARQARGQVEVVALTVDADDAALAAIVEAVDPDWLQLHGSETADRVAAVKGRFGVKVMKAVGLSGVEDLANADPFRAVSDAILFDAKPPRGAVLPGGNGVPFDWTLLSGETAPFMLSGGLTVETVAEAIRISGARAVDVSSGVESAPGVKDAAKIRAFVEAAKAAALTPSEA